VALATALAASLAIDPGAVSAHTTPSDATTTPEPPPVASSFPARATPPAEPTSPAETPSRSNRVRFVAGSEIGTTFGVFSDATPRLGVAIGVEADQFRHELIAGYDLPQYVPAPGQVARGARLQLDTFKFRSCFAPNFRSPRGFDGPVELDACLSTEAGWFSADGIGVSSPAHGAHPWWAALAGVRLVWHLRDVLEWRLSADVGASLVRPVFEITGTYPTFVHQPSAVIGQGTFSAIVRFP
jgi:hypothetical protein